jgi:hypothetical protein
MLSFLTEKCEKVTGNVTTRSSYNGRETTVFTANAPQNSQTFVAPISVISVFTTPFDRFRWVWHFRGLW